MHPLLAAVALLLATEFCLQSGYCLVKSGSAGARSSEGFVDDDLCDPLEQTFQVSEAVAAPFLAVMAMALEQLRGVVKWPIEQLGNCSRALRPLFLLRHFADTRMKRVQEVSLASLSDSLSTLILAVLALGLGSLGSLGLGNILFSTDLCLCWHLPLPRRLGSLGRRLSMICLAATAAAAAAAITISAQRIVVAPAPAPAPASAVAAVSPALAPFASGGIARILSSLAGRKRQEHGATFGFCAVSTQVLQPHTPQYGDPGPLRQSPLAWILHRRFQHMTTGMRMERPWPSGAI